MGIERMKSWPASAAAAFAARAKRAGQVTVELLLVLPVFMLLLFFIMEIGNLGFQTILAHHCAYELARIGSLIAGKRGDNTGGGESLANQKMQNVVKQMFPSTQVQVEGAMVPNSIPVDPQSGQQSEDWVVTMVYPAKLIFPGSSYVLADNKYARTKKIVVKVRMPVEEPYFK